MNTTRLKLIIAPTVLAAVGVTLGMGTAGAAPAQLRSPNQPTVTTLPPPPEVTDDLTAIACPAANDCITVGQRGTIPGSLGALAETWNGKAWSVASLPTPTGVSITDLESISCASPTSCMAVGFGSRATGGTPGVVEGYNGKSWSVLPAPAGDDYLYGVSCPTSTDCMAVGFTYGSVGTVPIASLWNGKSWTAVSVPLPAGSSGENSHTLRGISCSSTTACTAVGDNTIGSKTYAIAERWNGKTFTYQASPFSASVDAIFQGISCTTATSCVATGFSAGSGGWHAIGGLWNGKSWTATLNAAGPRGSLGGLACRSASDCLAVGLNSSNKAASAFWNGKSWSTFTSAGSGLLSLHSVAFTGPSSAIAVGNSEQSDGFHTLAEEWNGHGWTPLSIPNP